MVEKSKELLNSLYTKVLTYELPSENNIQYEKFSMRGQSYGAKAKNSFDLMLPLEKKLRKGYRPNYFTSEMTQPISKIFRRQQISPREYERRKTGILFEYFT